MISIEKASLMHASIIADFQVEMAWESEAYVLQKETIKKGVEHIFTHDDEGFYIIAKNQEQTIASLMVTYEWSDWRNSKIWWLQSVYVKPEFRKQGVFTKMYEYIKTKAIENGIKTIRLYVEKNNEKAVSIYLKNDFEITHYALLEHKLQE